MYQRGHALGLRHFSYFSGRGAAMNERADFIRDHKQFVKCDATPVPGSATGGTPFASIQLKKVRVWNAELAKLRLAVTMRNGVILFPCGSVGGFAVLTDCARKTLRKNAKEGVGKTERIDTHIEQSSDRFWCAVRV